MEIAVVEGERAIGGLASSPASPLLTIGDFSQVEAVVEVPETDVRALTVGDSAWIELDALPGRRLPAALTRIGEAAAPRSAGDGDGRVGFAVTLTLIDPAEELRPGLSAVAEIIVDRRREAVAVPIVAATVRDSRPGDSEARGSRTPADVDSPEEGVFRVRGGRAVWNPVELGIGGQEYFEVLSGIAPGDTVVGGPYETIRSLRDGDPVQAIADPFRATAEPVTPY